MMQELKNTKQNHGELFRRWFHDDYFDLIMWFNPDASTHSFQLCYDKKGCEKVLSWSSSGEYSHNRIDDGEGRPFRHKSAPIAVADGMFDAMNIAEKFIKASAALPDEVSSFVRDAIQQYQP